MSKVCIAACAPQVQLARPVENAYLIIEKAKKAVTEGAKLIVFPELAICGYTCGDLLLQDTLISEADRAIDIVVSASKNIDGTIILGAPVANDGALYNAAIVIQKGAVTGCYYKTDYDDSHGLIESRYFCNDSDEIEPEGTEFVLNLGNDKITCTTILGDVDTISGFEGDLVINLSEGVEYLGRPQARFELAQKLSEGAAYILSSSGFGESTTDFVYSGLKIIAQDGEITQRGCGRCHEIIYGDIDTDFPCTMVSEASICPDKGLASSMTPYLPDTEPKTLERAIELQTRGLKSRLEAIHCNKAVIGISGGLDSTLALLVTVKAFEMAGFDKKNITAVTMPCFGTSSTTHDFALGLMKELGVTYREINIKETVSIHLKDIEHDMENHNIAFENAQARERTQVLMDLANDLGAIVIGTGDMSEAALGWCTYNGDHMSMYDVNAGIPKTLVRYIVAFVADTCNNETLSTLLRSIIEIPVSPELVPGENGQIGQKTEDIIGPYIVHDFIMYYMVSQHLSPTKIYNLAVSAFDGIYSSETILKTLKTFYSRFFKSQFKRSCSADGPMILSFSLSPRGGLMIPSDASGSIWLEEINKIL